MPQAPAHRAVARGEREKAGQLDRRAHNVAGVAQVAVYDEGNVVKVVHSPAATSCAITRYGLAERYLA